MRPQVHQTLGVSPNTVGVTKHCETPWGPWAENPLAATQAHGPRARPWANRARPKGIYREYYREYSLTVKVTGNSREFPGNPSFPRGCVVSSFSILKDMLKPIQIVLCRFPRDDRPFELQSIATYFGSGCRVDGECPWE